jgi:hypothetical protein
MHERMGMTLLDLSGNAPRPQALAQERAGMTLLDLSEAREAMAAKPALVKEVVGPMLFTMNAGDGEDVHFQRITSPNSLRDLNPFMQQRMQQVCFYLAVTNPFCKQIIRMITAFVVGEGFQVNCEDEATQEVIDKFWNDPINDMENNLSNWQREKLIFGELCLPVAVNPVDGFVRLGYIDPADVASIRYGLLQTGDGEQEISIPTQVKLCSRAGDPAARELEIIREDEDVSSPTYGRLIGKTFYFAINKAKMGTRGISEVFALADWVDVLDQMVFDFADRARYLNQFIWDVTVTGATENELQKFNDEFGRTPPRQGSVRCHNEKMAINAVTPDLKGADFGDSIRNVKHYGCGGAGLPPHWMGDPNDANRAVAAEMDGPTGKVLTEHQNLLIRDTTQILKFVIAQAKLHGTLAEDADETFTIQTPDLLMKDFAKGAVILQGATTSLALAEDRGWIRGVTAARAFANVLTQIGTDIDDPQDEYDQAQKEQQDKKARDINNLMPQSALANALAQKPAPGAVVQKDAADNGGVPLQQPDVVVN